VTAQGEEILAWLEIAITERENVARDACDGGEGRWHSGWCSEDELEEGETSGAGVGDERDRTVVYDEGRPSKAQSIHIALNDPESVLRRCAADRKLIYEVRRTAENAKGNPWDRLLHGYGPYADAMLAAAKVVAEGYGWTGDEQ
jgi:hypothetical protein